MVFEAIWMIRSLSLALTMLLPLSALAGSSDAPTPRPRG